MGAHLFGELQGASAPRPAPPEPAAEVAEHPCKAEVEHCLAENGDTSNAAIRTCLKNHIGEPGFSHTCKCFLLQVESSAHKTHASGSPAVRVVPVVEVDLRPHPMRHAFCMIFMMTMIFSLALLLRRCCLCFCTSKPQFAAVVPPEQATTKTVEPLMCVPVKELPAKEQA